MKMGRGIHINGQWQKGEGDVFDSICPSTGNVVWSGHAATPKQVNEAYDAASSAFQEWSCRPQSDRTAILEAYAAEIEARSDEFAETIGQDMGKVVWEARGEVAAMKGKVAISIAAQLERAGDKLSPTPFGSNRLSHRAHGVMGVFGPFNFPGHLPNGHIVPALLAGNTCIFKPSELAPSVAELIVDAFKTAGLPAGCLNVVQGGQETGQALLDTPLSGVLFTGSAKTGKLFHKYFAGRPEVILALEMGGNNPLIIWDPVDIEAAADIAAQSAFFTTGQRCSCARRLFLPEGTFGDDVIEALVARSNEIKIGHYGDATAFMGPLVSTHAAGAAVKVQSELRHNGGRLIREMKQTNQGAAFVSPGIIDMTSAGEVPDEELFAPFLQIFRVPTFEAAIIGANNSRYGLSGGLVCDDEALWDEAYIRMRAGILNRNRPTAGASGSMPFGGPGLSGNARPGAYYAADYCAWPQASQISEKANRLPATGFPSSRSSR